MSKDNSDIYFSVIIPLYNKEKSVSSTVESVLNQTYPHFELIVVNDGSTDNSLEVVQQFNDPRIRIIDKRNGGVSSARNVGIKAAKYEYLIPLDADDLWLPFALAEFVELIRNYPKAQVFATNFNITGKNLKGTEKRYYVNDFYYSSAIFMAKWNIPLMVTGCVAFHKSCIHISGLYDEEVSHGEDIDFWMRLKDNFRIAKSELVTLIYRFNVENRASLMPEESKRYKNNSSIQEYTGSGKSFNLFQGCNDLMKLFSERNILKSFRLVVSDKINLYWVLRAALLYMQHRIFKKI